MLYLHSNGAYLSLVITTPTNPPSIYLHSIGARPSREASPERSTGELQYVGAAGGQRERTPGGALRPDAATDH